MRWMVIPLAAAALTLAITISVPANGESTRVPQSEAGTFTASSVSLSDAIKQAEPLVGGHIEVQLEPSHPARKRRVSLSMPVDEPNDLLNALAASYGLRWVSQSGGRVVFVDKRAYRMHAIGLRQSVADALPQDLHFAVTGDANTRLANVEGILKTLEARSEAQLTDSSSRGPVAIDALDPSLSRPLVGYLNSFTAYKLGNMCDEAATDFASNSKSRFHYGANPKGTKQFSFLLRNGWLAVRPE